MRNRRFMLYLLAIFIATIFLIVFLQYNSNNNINKLIEGNESLISEFQIIGETQKLETDMLYIESHIYRTVFSEDSSFLEGINVREKNVRTGLLKLQPLVLTDSTKKLVQKLDSLIEAKLDVGHAVVNTLFTKGQLAAIEMYKTMKTKYIMGEIVQVIDLLSKPRQQYLTKLAVDANKSGNKAREWGSILAITTVLACVFTFGYITKRFKRQQQLYDQLNESEKKVREAGIIKEKFIANMSHEIRTPMNAILGFTNLLRKEQLNEKSKEFVCSISNSGENLLGIINDILDFSKIEAGMMRIESNPFSLRGLLHSVKIMFDAKIQTKNLRFTVQAENSIPDELIGDPVRLTQILVNLVNNAVKFTNHGGIEINVTTGERTGDRIEIFFSVKDTGIGIASNKMETIFERFQQADEDTTRKYGGTGLGLSIVKQLVELQNGTILAKSVLNEGTEFVFSIPYAVSKELIEPVDLKKIFSTNEITFADADFRILVAEDNVMNQNLMRHLLTYWNLGFDIVNNGEEVIEALQQNDYRLLLMDIQMPVIDGYTATMKIRNELRMDIPIIAMTAHAMAGEREKCLSYGMNEYISKPIHEDELLKIMNDILKTNNGNAEIIIENSGVPVRNGELLNLDYLREVSGGDTAFEINMIEQFLQQVPGELDAMKENFSKENYAGLMGIAHNLKTTVSFMGLTKKLNDYLDYIETNANVQSENHNVGDKIRIVNKICRQVIREATDYLQRTA